MGHARLGMDIALQHLYDVEAVLEDPAWPIGWRWWLKQADTALWRSGLHHFWQERSHAL